MDYPKSDLPIRLLPFVAFIVDDETGEENKTTWAFWRHLRVSGKIETYIKEKQIMVPSSEAKRLTETPICYGLSRRSGHIKWKV